MQNFNEMFVVCLIKIHHLQNIRKTLTNFNKSSDCFLRYKLGKLNHFYANLNKESSVAVNKRFLVK